MRIQTNSAEALAKVSNELFEHNITTQTRHENFHGKFSLCAEYLSRLIGQKLTCMLKVFTDYSEVFI